MLTLVVGGVRSGKSRYAEKKALSLPGRHFYYASALAFDAEMEARIRRHREDRGDRFFTVETPYFTKPKGRHRGDDVVLFECLTVLVANLHYQKPTIQPSDIVQGLLALDAQVGHLIVVSNHLFCDVHRAYSEETRDYLKRLAACHKGLAARADAVVEIRAGAPFDHKGGRP